MSTNGKHTPGPWFAQGGTIYGSPGRSNNPTRNPVADMVRQPNTKANEALLTAAPDLLAALKLTTSTPCNCRGCVVGRAAIARAEGREP